MSIATEILDLRRNRESSVKLLIARIDWHNAYNSLHRQWEVREAADLVLANVAAHAADAMNEPPKKAQTTRRAAVPNRRRRRFDPGQSHQRMLFVASNR